MSSLRAASRTTEPTMGSENARAVLNDGKNRNLWKLPSAWNWSTVGQITEVIRGASPRPKGDPRYFGGDVPWIMIADVTRQPGKYLYRTREGVTEAGAALSRRIPAGELILSNSATVCVPKILKVEGCIHDGFVAFPTLKERVLLDFAYYWFEFIRPTMIQENRQGVTQVNLNTGIVRQMHFPLAPRAEQERVVAEIEKQFSRLDAGVAALRRVQANLKRYRAAVLKAACEGRLVPTEAELARKERRSFETGADLLAQILKERSQVGGRGRYEEVANRDALDLPHLPEGWVWCMSDILFAFVTSGSRGWAKHYSDDGPIFLRIGNLEHENIRLDLSDTQHVSPPSGAEGVRTSVQPRDILISITADVGMVGLVPNGLGEAYINQHVALARPVALVSAAYLAHYLSASEGGWGRLKKAQRGATKVGLGLNDIRSVPVPLPPLAEQARVVAEVERRLSVVEDLEATVTANLQRATRLRQSVLQAAFSGERPRVLTGGTPSVRLDAR